MHFLAYFQNLETNKLFYDIVMGFGLFGIYLRTIVYFTMSIDLFISIHYTFK